jgi:hypothetical protein
MTNQGSGNDLAKGLCAGCLLCCCLDCIFD